jgi:uncharacterized phage-associated protein
MNSRIRYRINYAKAIETIVWLANQKPGIDIYHVAKILFYADKKHINRYARPIIGDTYICADYGPLPSGVHDLITESSWLSPDYLAVIADSLIIQRSPYVKIGAARKPNMEYFSETDIECLKEALKEYRNKSFEELKKLTHNERCYLETDLNQPIDYALMVERDNPNREEILKKMSETSPYIVF